MTYSEFKKSVILEVNEVRTLVGGKLVKESAKTEDLLTDLFNGECDIRDASDIVLDMGY